MSAAPTPDTWPVLTTLERRVLGVLVEKAKTTPDAYPLSLNALVTGCNQKSNRDPVMNVADHQVEEALSSGQKKGLVIKITGGRVERWRHNLYEAWRVEKVELAILGELLLRGPQTEGELRARAARMEPIADLDALRAALRPMVERRLVVYLTPEGRRGTVLTHGFHSPEELERLRAEQGADVESGETPGADAPASSPVQASDASERLEAAHAEIAAQRSALAELQAQVASLAEQVRAIKESLGI
jgi:uncharacterized protein YceH (UPF0502 family)